jgi:hypothetical protein
MRVSIEHSEKTEGLIFKTKYFHVKLKVEFSNEERAIIQQRKLEKDIIMERNPPADVKVKPGDNLNIFDLTIGKLAKRGEDTYVVATPLEAKSYEGELVQRLQVLKAHIMENASTGTSKSFEL